ncbi:MAG: D-alanyl-D-alanine carboxypeptidase [Verrucomicrobia bacterium]|nr:D-alanyl-D-alanine carboxypeptidase [Verrucomicrobiota bacterium]
MLKLISPLIVLRNCPLIFISAFILAQPWAYGALKVDMSAKAAILINEETGAVLYEKNAHTPLYPASITKVITALYALEKKGNALEEEVIATHDAVSAVHPHIRRAQHKGHPPYRLEFGGTHIGIKAGEALTLRTLLYGLMLASGNDAANVIAQHVSGSVPQFMNELNAYVKAKGCKDTILFTPHGLPHPDHKTTAYDMAKLTRIALQYPIFREVVKAVKFPRPQTNKQVESEFHQHNALVKPGKFYYPKATGVKTGYTTAGGYTLVASAEDENRKLIAVLLGYEQLQERYKDAIALFEAAFNEPKVARTLFSKEFDLFSCAVKGGKKPLQAAIPADLVLSYYPSEEPQFNASIEWNALDLPIEPGKLVGQIRVTSIPKGKTLVQMPLFSTQLVEATLSYRLELAWQECKRAMGQKMGLLMGAMGIALISFSFYLFYPRRKKKKSRRAI